MYILHSNPYCIHILLLMDLFTYDYNVVPFFVDYFSCHFLFRHTSNNVIIAIRQSTFQTTVSSPMYLIWKDVKAEGDDDLSICSCFTK